MGGAGLILGPLLIIVLAVVVVVGVVVALPQIRQARSGVTQGSATPPLRFRPPEGQDSAAVVRALEDAGLRAVTTMQHGDNMVVIETDDDQTRERARSAISGAPLALGEEPDQPTPQVRFEDERAS